MRTNIEIDDKLMQDVLAISGLRTKKAVVALALKRFLQFEVQKKLLSLKGKVCWEGDLSEMRTDDHR